MFLTFRLASEFWGVAGFAEWVMARRLMAFIVPVITMGMDVGLTRAIASSRENCSQSYLQAACLVVGVMAAAATIAAVPLADEISRIVFGSIAHAELVLPVVFMSAAYAFYVLLYGCLRGRIQIMEANLAHIVAYGVLPLCVISMVHESPAQAITAIGVVAAIATGLVLVRYLSASSSGASALSSRTRELVSYGGTRMIAAMLLMSLALIPASIAAYRSGIEAGGFVALALSVVGLAGSASAPIQLILLPMASAMWAKGQREELKVAFGRLERVIIFLGIAALLIVPFSAPLVSILVVGKRQPELEQVLRLAALSVGPFMYFVCGRQVIDACTVKGTNTRNLLLGGLGFLVALGILLAFGVGDVTAVMLSYSSAMLVLAIATGWAIRSLFRGLSTQSGQGVPE